MGCLWRLAGIGWIGIAFACGSVAAGSSGVDAAAESSGVDAAAESSGVDAAAEGASSVDGASDAGGADEGAIDAPEEAAQRFMCGTITGTYCDPTTEICDLMNQGAWPPAEGCAPIPAQCVSNPTCACIQPALDAGQCFESSNGGVTVCWESTLSGCK
jgi:hypothetical protein